ncbi:sulfurtransferase complex subunit TusC [Shewanella yunxiaonensis]|uniref:Sulfurtransferase complex subunit TusC n=1 Tax=Shewanella yunxiaonensis TaxID=2829809 RepID=A0ABX7YNV5_9GAMM|nr:MULTISPECIES: sulfurtransferase complex subunit TusC [Shewanella]MDF0535989.1 sulfurtransferase complex subunit TusC [Shewanella sp. A32]QUN04382.1 sulfurtransferase complex subunit TusC [Shewanella yunxiaonensis]
MKSIAIIFRQGPHGNEAGREALDLALMAATYEQQVHLVFIDSGVLNLLSGQQPELIGCKDYIATFKALDIYDVASVSVSESAILNFGLANLPLIYPAELVDDEQIRKLLEQVDEVLVF